jgi:EAL domain-containing protein (putative c-di-GMP-specific phosphodiesterase class I)
VAYRFYSIHFSPLLLTAFINGGLPDDLGIEYSSMSRLTQFPFDTVKIDRFFTQKVDIENRKASKSIISSLIQLANDLNFTLIAEGAETESQVQYLKVAGCQYIQGFYFYKPMPLRKACKLINK